MQKTKTKTGVAVALVTLSIVGTVAAATIIISRNRDVNIVKSVRSVASQTPQTTTTPQTITPPVTTPPVVTPDTDEDEALIPDTKDKEKWATQEFKFGGWEGTNGVIGSANLNKSIKVRYLVGENINETVTASFSSRLAGMDRSTLKCEGGGNGIGVSYTAKSDNTVECVITGKVTAEGLKRITFSGMTKSYSRTIPARTCTQQDVNSFMGFVGVNECQTVGQVIPSKVVAERPIEVSIENPLVFYRCADGQKYDSAQEKCVNGVSVDAPLCSATGGESPENPRCLIVNENHFYYPRLCADALNITSGKKMYFKLIPYEGQKTLTIEHVSCDQQANVDLFAQEGSIRNIDANMETALQAGYNKGYKATVGGIRNFANFSRSTSEANGLGDAKPGTPYYVVVKNQDTSRRADIMFYSTNH